MKVAKKTAAATHIGLGLIGGKYVAIPFLLYQFGKHGGILSGWRCNLEFLIGLGVRFYVRKRGGAKIDV